MLHIRAHFALLIVWFLSVGTAFASIEMLALDVPVFEGDMAGHVDYFLDHTNTLDLEAVRAGSERVFQPGANTMAGFGNTDATIWLKLDLVNPSDMAINRVLQLVTNFMPQLDVWLERDGQIRSLLSQNDASTFSTRPVPHPNLVQRFALDPGEQATLWIAYSSRGTTALPIRIIDDETFLSRTWNTALWYLLFYAVTGVMVAISIFAFLVSPHRLFLAYAVYGLTILLYLMHRDGFTFQYFWPNAPGLNGFISLPIGAALAMFSSTFTIAYLGTGQNYRRIHILLVAIVVLTPLLIPGAFVFGESAMKALAAQWVAVVALILLCVGIYAARYEGPELIYFCLGWLGIVTASFIMVARTFGFEISRTLILNAIRFAMVFDALMIGLAVVSRVLAMRRAVNQSLQFGLEALQFNASLVNRLDRLENRYFDTLLQSEEARRLARETAHDIRQPVYALRQSINRLKTARTATEDETSGVKRALGYLEGIVDNLIQEAGLSGKSPAPRVEKPANYPVQNVLDAVQDMFQADAMAKCMRFLVRPTVLETDKNMLALLRIASNLTSNAIRHSNGPVVVIGAVRIRGDYWLCVADRGTGLPKDLARYLRDGIKVTGPATPKGDGLKIIRQIAQENGLEMATGALPNGGTCIACRL